MIKYCSIFLSVFFVIGCALPSPRTPEERYQHAMKELESANSEQQRFYALNSAAKESFNQGRIKEANAYAQELAELYPKYKKDWNYGNAIQDVNLVRGRIAVRNNRIEEAKRYLLLSGTTPGSPQMNTFGPNMSLAKDLLEQGEKEVVLQYFELCRNFWDMADGRLDDWSSIVKNNRIPEFGANLVY